MGVHNLPSAYLELEWIQSTGSQWIDTDLFASANDILTFVGKFDTYTGQAILGCHHSGTYRLIGMASVDSVYKFFAPTGYWNENVPGGITGTGYPVKNADLDEHTFVYKYVRNSLTIDGTEYALYNGLDDASASRNYPSKREGWDNSMVLFGYRHDSTYEIYSHAYFTMKYCKIEQNGVTTGEYIPALRKSDMKPGLYDLISETFLTNGAQTGADFAYQIGSYETLIGESNTNNQTFLFSSENGSIIPPNTDDDGYIDLEWIGSTGTQYIITDITPKIEYNIEVKAQKEMITALFGVGSPTYVLTGNSSYGNYFYVGRTTSSGSDRQLVTVTDQNAVHIWGINNKVGYCDGVSATSVYGTTQPSDTMAFFGRHSQGSVSDCGKHRIYYAKVWDENGTLIGDFVPRIQLSTGKPGLYDNITSTFYANQGTNEFTYELPNYKTFIYMEEEGE